MLISTNGIASESKANRMLKKGYQLVVNNQDTLAFETLYLDGEYYPNFSVNKKTKTVHLTIHNNPELEILSYDALETIFKENATGISWVMFQGTYLNRDNKVYFQRSLITDPTRIPDESLTKISCRRAYGGDALIFW